MARALLHPWRRSAASNLLHFLCADCPRASLQAHAQEAPNGVYDPICTDDPISANDAARAAQAVRADDSVSANDTACAAQAVRADDSVSANDAACAAQAVRADDSVS